MRNMTQYFSNKFTKWTAISLAALSISLLACDNVAVNEGNGAPAANETKLSIEYEKITLKNGLDVIFHVDRSDPVVAIDIAAHVGSARELKGKTGFAHLFEHLLFMDSENLGFGGLDEMNTRIGGEGTNGFTTHDMTQYYQAVPKDALEKVIWAEADKLCCFISTVSQNVIDIEKQVVKNEKRLRVDNRPYGHNFYIINKALYSEDHPYNWQVIGSLEDLEAASLDYTKDFYKRWYTPNNVTVTLAGDFDLEEAKTLMIKYFEDIPAGEEIEKYKPRPSDLSETMNIYYEDNFATVPQFTMIWPTVEQYHPDSYALNILMDYLTDGKKAPLSEVLIDEKKLTSSVTAFQYSKEIAGEAYIYITPNEGQDIDGLMPAIDSAFARFEENGISQSDLERIKAGLEVQFFNGMQSALGKAIALSEYNLFADNPGFIVEDVKRMQAVTVQDVMRVYNQYIKNKPRLYTSIVPKDQTDLTLDGAELAAIVEEAVTENVDIPRTERVLEGQSNFVRSEPEFGDSYTLPTPQVWKTEFPNGIKMFGISSNEIPVVQFSLRIDAGNERGDFDKPAVPDLVSSMLEKGTANKTTAELENAIKSLGSQISVSTSARGTYISGWSLSRNFDTTMALVEEMILEPRWDETEFDLLKRKIGNDIDQLAGDPTSIAAQQAAKLRYPEGHILGNAFYGPKEKLEAVTLDDLKAFYTKHYSQNGMLIRIAGDIDAAAVKNGLSRLGKLNKAVLSDVKLDGPIAVNETTIYFYDFPGAKQSVLRMERPALSAMHEDFSLAQNINFPLGGIYTSKLMTTLRVDKGYTYGIRSGFNGGKDAGTFAISSSVRTNVTKESIALILDIIGRYGPEFTDADLDTMKEALIRGQALENETLSDKLSMVNDISYYGYPDNFMALNAEKTSNLTLDKVNTLTSGHIRSDAIRILVVGDAETQLERVKELGYPVIMLE